MQKEANEVLIISIKRLLRRGATKQLKNIIHKTHTVDLSAVFRELSPDNRGKLFSLIETLEQKGILLAKLEESTFLDLVKTINFEELVLIFDEIPADDAAELLGMLDEEFSDEILEKMKTKGSDDVEELMSHAEDTAGSLMMPDFIALREDMGAREVINALQNKFLDVEMPFYIYVIDEYDKLVGVSSLRQLVVVHPEKPLKEFMARDIVSVKTYTDREEVAKVVSRYDYLAVPVVDDDNRIVGIVTVDDVIDILHDSATEDMLKMAGVGEDYIETQTIVRGAKIRLPWLFASFLGGIATFFIIDRNEAIITQYACLAAFTPVISGMGGNIATQSSTIVVRGIATGMINIRAFWKIISKELSIGLSLGVFYGVFIGIITSVVYKSQPFFLPLAVSVGLAVLASMALAAFLGSGIPLVFEKMHIDPAVATGPFVTTMVDIVSISCYFLIATIMLHF